MTSLSKLGYVGIAKESTQGTYVTPAFYLPCTKIDAEDVFITLRDESYRNNDSTLQGQYQGAGDSTFDIDVMAYPDSIPYLFRGIIGPDTVTAGTSTTLSADTAANATSISLTASVASNTVLKISDATGANLEYVKIGTVTGSGPYVCPITTGGGTGGNTTQYAHTAAGGSVVSQSTHTFKQSATATQTSWSLTKYDVATNATASHTRGFPGSKISECAIKIDPKAVMTFSVKYVGWLSAEQTDPTPTFTPTIPGLGWEWTMTNAGGSSTRGLTYDLTIKRATEAIHASNGGVSITAHSPITISNQVIGDDIALSASTDITLQSGSQLNATNTIKLAATNNIVLGGLLSVSSPSGSISAGEAAA